MSPLKMVSASALLLTMANLARQKTRRSRNKFTGIQTDEPSCQSWCDGGHLSIAHCVAGALEIELCLLLAVKMLPSPSLSSSSSSCWYCSLFSHGKGTASRRAAAWECMIKSKTRLSTFITLCVCFMFWVTLFLRGAGVDLAHSFHQRCGASLRIHWGGSIAQGPKIRKHIVGLWEKQAKEGIKERQNH